MRTPWRAGGTGASREVAHHSLVVRDGGRTEEMERRGDSGDVVSMHLLDILQFFHRY
jgi:hypothetical protein